MAQPLLRADLRATRRRRVAPSSLQEWAFVLATSVGFVVGLVITVFREQVVPAQFGRDAEKIWKIASGQWPDFRDRSFTPVANVYRFLGLGDLPLIANLFGYLLAAAAILLALYRSGRRTAGVGLALYILATFVVAGVYLGQYSKDVFVLPAVMLLFLLPRRWWWEIPAVTGMLAYAYWFRDYWAIIAAGYVFFRFLTIVQVRVRYLLLVGALGSAAVGLAFWLVLDKTPNYYRTHVQQYLDANSLIRPIEPVAQPWGGLVDVFLNYWLILTPVTLPLTAGLAYAGIALALSFTRVLPLIAVRSSIRWPSARTLDGALLRRSLSLLLAFGAVQALFEPDYGSVIRHLAPLLPLAVVMMQAARSGSPRPSAPRRMSWTGAAKIRES